MAAVIGHLTVDSADPGLLAQWWAQVLGWLVEDESDPDEIWVESPDGGQPGILFLRVADAKVVKNRLHLDLRPADSSDQESELARLLALGATSVDIGQGEVPWYVLADPEGNEFCLLRSTPAQLAAMESQG